MKHLRLEASRTQREKVARLADGGIAPSAAERATNILRRFDSPTEKAAIAVGSTSPSVTALAADRIGRIVPSIAQSNDQN